MQSMTYGELPSRDDFDSAWDRLDRAGELRGGLYHISLSESDSRAVDGYSLGDGAWTQDQLWDALEEINGDTIEGTELVGSILYTLGFEWI